MGDLLSHGMQGITRPWTVRDSGPKGSSSVLQFSSSLASFGVNRSRDSSAETWASFTTDSALIFCGRRGGGSSLRASLSSGCSSSGFIGAFLPRIWIGNLSNPSATSLQSASWKRMYQFNSKYKFKIDIWSNEYVETVHFGLEVVDLLLDQLLFVLQLWERRHVLIHQS